MPESAKHKMMLDNSMKFYRFDEDHLGKSEIQSPGMNLIRQEMVRCQGQYQLDFNSRYGHSPVLSWTLALSSCNVEEIVLS